MRVLWIVHDVMKPVIHLVKGKPTTGGSWIDPLFYSLAKEKDLTLGVIFPVIQGQFQSFSHEGIKYYTIPIKKGTNTKKLSDYNVRHYLKAITDFSPDIIHVHGTEKNFGTLRRFVEKKIPMVCSIQGIVNSCIPYLVMSYSGNQLKNFKSLKNYLRRGGVTGLQHKWESYGRLEKEIFAVNQYFIGRTLWDKAQSFSLNANINYYQGEELLRPPFYSTKWDIDYCERNSIFISSGAYPIKGLHVLIQAVNIIKHKYNNLKIYVPLARSDYNSKIVNKLIGEDYALFISHLIKKYKLRENFVFLPRLNADEMACHYKKAHVFVLPSFIENSPNSLGEAMTVGTPSIVSFTGGVSSIVKHGESALMHPIGDYSTLAYQINELFSNDELAKELSKNAKEVANKRHDVLSAVQQYVDVYENIIHRHKNLV